MKGILVYLFLGVLLGWLVDLTLEAEGRSDDMTLLMRVILVLCWPIVLIGGIIVHSLDSDDDNHLTPTGAH